MEIKTLDLRRRDQGTGTGKLMNVTELLPRNAFTPEFVYHFKRWGRGGRQWSDPSPAKDTHGLQVRKPCMGCWFWETMGL